MVEAEEPQGKLIDLFKDQIRDNPNFAPVFLRKRNQEASDAQLLTFERHFNQDLAADSDYFRSINRMFTCVQKNADKELSEKEMDKVCAKEYKEMRLQAFNNKVFYHEVNKKHFMNELALYKHETPY